MGVVAVSARAAELVATLAESKGEAAARMISGSPGGRTSLLRSRKPPTAYVTSAA